MQKNNSNPDDGSETAAPVPPWLELPDPCLVAVLRCCAVINLRTLFSAARAHSRLRQAAVLALDSIKAGFRRQQQMDSLLLCLSKHGQHVRSISLRGAGGPVTLRQLPPGLNQLTSLECEYLDLQLQPGSGPSAVLPPDSPLKQLRLKVSTSFVLDGKEGLTAQLTQLPALEHLSIAAFGRSMHVRLSQGVMQRLSRLTFLELWPVQLQPVAQGQPSNALQDLAAMTRLADLRLCVVGPSIITAAMLAGAQGLTTLHLSGLGTPPGVLFEPGVLAGKSRLQQLVLQSCRPSGVGTAALLSQLQQLQHLEFLVCHDCFSMSATNSPPAAAYAALTASSKLQSFGLASCTLPEAVWKHIFPAGRQLPHLQGLHFNDLRHPTGLPTGSTAAAAPEGGLLANCCPRLRRVCLHGLQCTTQLLTFTALTGLRDLEVKGREGGTATADQLPQLSSLQQLTRLTVSRGEETYSFKSQGPDGEPVWRQLLQPLRQEPDRKPELRQLLQQLRHQLDLASATVAQRAMPRLADQ